jgi:hypothetical protein
MKYAAQARREGDAADDIFSIALYKKKGSLSPSSLENNSNNPENYAGTIETIFWLLVNQANFTFPGHIA